MSDLDLKKVVQHFEEKRKQDNDRFDKRFRDLTELLGKVVDRTKRAKSQSVSDHESEPADRDDDVSIRSDRSGSPPPKKKKGNQPEPMMLDMSSMVEKESLPADQEDQNVLIIPDSEEIARLLDDLSESETTGSRLPKYLEDLVNARFRCSLTTEQSKLYGERYPRPEEADGLVVPVCNREVWKNMPREAKYADLFLNTVQKQMSTAASAQAEVVLKLNALKKELAKEKPDLDSQRDVISQCLMTLGESVTLTGSAFHHISSKRRKDIMPCLQPQLADLASDHTPVTDKLFGNHLVTEVMEIREVNKCAVSIAGPKSAIASTSGVSGQKAPFRQGYGYKGKKKFNPKWQNQSQSPNKLIKFSPTKNLRGANYRGRGRGRGGRF